MANEVLVGLKIGAAVSGTLHAAFGSARSTVQQLGRVTDELSAKQGRLGQELSASIARGGSGVARLRQQYDQVGRTVEQLRAQQERLNASIARGETLKAQRADLRGEAMETIGTGVAVGAPVVRALRTSIDFKDQTNDIAITGGFDPAEEARLAEVMRGAALKWNQTQSDVAKGTQVLIAGGISNAKELEAYAPIMAKAATATRASMDDLGSVAIALNDNLGIGAAGLERSMNMLAYAGKQGQFELRDMAKWLPQLTPQFAALGVTGERAVAEIGASLQIARRGAGTNDEAANNFKNFLTKITAPETLKSFKDAGIDLKQSMQNLVGSGLTPVQAMLRVITQYVGTKGPKASAEFQKAMALKDDQERQMALNRLGESYRLGELFADMQVLSFIRPAMANQKDLSKIQQGSTAAADQGVLDADWKKRMESPREELKRLGNTLSDTGIAVGSVLLPALVDVTQAVVPVVRQFSAWAGENPELIKGVIGLVGGLLAGKLAFVGLKYGINLALSPLTALTTTVTALSSRWTLLRGLWQAGRFAPLVTGLARVGGGMLTVLKYAGLMLKGFGMAFGAPLMLAGKGLLLLGRVLAGGLLSGLRLAGQAILWLGRALLMNPIGLLVTGIALAGYLIYHNWGTLGPFFKGLWAEVKTAFSGGLGGIAGLILNFSPVGLFYRAFAGVMSYFGIELPSKFTEFGGMLISGLVDGILSMAGSLKDSVLGIGSSIKSWFTGEMQIKSPSRVFMGYGENIGQGAALGIAGSAGRVREAALGLAAATAVSLAAPEWTPPQAPTVPERVASVPVQAPPSLTTASLTATGREGTGSGIADLVGLLKRVGLGMAAPVVSLTAPKWALPQAPTVPEQAAPVPLQAPPSLTATGSGGTDSGIAELVGLLKKAGLGMPAPAASLPPPESGPATPIRTPPNLTAASLATGMPATGSTGMTVHFSPTIHVQGGNEVGGQVREALTLSFAEFERFMQRYQQQQARRSYGDIG